MSAIALLVAATLAQAGTLRSDLALRGGGAGRSAVSAVSWLDCAESVKGSAPDWTRAATEWWPCGGASNSATAGAAALGDRGAAMWPPVTHKLYRGNELDRSETWVNTKSGAPIVVTADAAAGPDGTQTAEKLEVPAVSGGGYAVLDQSFTATAAPWTVCAWGQSTSGATFYINLWSGATTYAKGCQFTAAWSECCHTRTLTAAPWHIELGVDKSITGTTDQPAQTVYLTRVDSYPVAFRVSNVPASNAAIDQPATVMALDPRRVFGGSRARGSMTIVPAWANATAQADRTLLLTTGLSLTWVNASGAFAFTAGGQTATQAATITAESDVLLAWQYSVGAPACLSVNGVQSCSAGNVAAFLPGANLYVGSSQTSGFGGWLKRVSMDRSPNAWLPGRTAYAIGDSITAGAGLNPTYPASVATSLGAAWSVTNGGVGGNTTAQIAARWPTVSGNGYAWTFVLGGINDIISDIAEPVMAANLSSIYTSAASLGTRPVAISVLPWRNHAQWNTDRQNLTLDLNSSINAACVALPGCVFVDAYTDMDDGTGRLQGIYDSGDGLHINQAGANRLAALVVAAINSP